MKKLKNGWVEGTVAELLQLSPSDVEYIETRRALGSLLRSQRIKLQLTQTELASRLKTSQSRLAKMESADPSVSADLLLNALFALGLNRKQVAKAF